MKKLFRFLLIAWLLTLSAAGFPDTETISLGSRTGGTLIDPGVRGRGNLTGGDVRSEEEWILKDGKPTALL